MSANNRMVIVRLEDRKYAVYHDGCVDNEFDFREHRPIAVVKTEKEARLIASKEYAEYGVDFIDARYIGGESK